MGQRNRPEPEPMFMEPEMYFDVRENNVPVVNLEVYSPTASRDARPGTPVYNPDVESPSASPLRVLRHHHKDEKRHHHFDLMKVAVAQSQG